VELTESGGAESDFAALPGKRWKFAHAAACFAAA